MDNKLQKLNNDIINLFENKQSFSLIRIGAMEGYFIESFYNNFKLNDAASRALYYVAGVYPIDDNYLKNVFYEETINSIINSDMIGFVDIPETIKNNNKFLLEFCKGKPTFFKDEIGILNPTTVLKLKNPWTKCLKDKKVLVVSSHKKSILKQWENINKVWGEFASIVTPFELVDVVRSPFNPEIDDRQFKNCLTWDQTARVLEDSISGYDFDVLLVGAGAYSPILAYYAKKIGKIGITLNGDIQLLFGILGARWDYLKNDKERKYWIYPLEEDYPQNRNLFDLIEGKCYWKNE